MNRRQPILLLPVIACMISLAGGCGAPTRVSNPDYEAWVSFAPGSYRTFEGYQEAGKTKEPLRVTDKLLAKDNEKLILVRTIQFLGSGDKRKPRIARMVEWALIDPADHPRTHPNAKIRDIGIEKLKILGKTHICGVRIIEVRAKIEGFIDEEQDIWVKAHRHAGIPGGLAKVLLRTKTAHRTVVISGKVVRYEAPREKEN